MNDRKTGILLWSGILCFIGLIYATVPLANVLRSSLTDRFGTSIYDAVYLIVAVAVLSLLALGMRLRGKAKIRYFAGLAITATIYCWYMVNLPYAVERIHMLEYGVLGAMLTSACRRTIHGRIALPLALVLTFSIGLGDEAFQKLFPDRVAEIRDVLTNAVSGFLGSIVYYLSLGSRQSHALLRPAHFRFLVATTMTAAVGTGFFLNHVQGFGFLLGSKETGRFYTALSPAQYERINSSGKFLSVTEQRIYDNEALRHLFQRDYYLTREFIGADGQPYHQHWRAGSENRILERWYPLFTRANRRQFSSALLSGMDSSVAAAAQGVPVVWPDSLKMWVDARSSVPPGHHVSRVKGTVITSFTLRELLLAEAAVLFTLLLLLTRPLRPRRSVAKNAVVDLREDGVG